MCNGPDLIFNGSFERGFNHLSFGDVGRGWGAINNGGAANYGYYDEQWDQVIVDGKHGQLLEINSKSVYPTDADRYSGIYQRIDGLHPGAVYELTVRGLLRGEGNEGDPYRFSAQWGYTDGPSNNWQQVDHWEEMNLGPIYPRTEPVSMGQYTVHFRAPSQQITLFIRGWKKWAISNVEMDFNLDAISLRGCDGTSDAGPNQPMQPKHDGAMCVYIVKPGDVLSQIADTHHVSVQEIIRANGIQNPNIIYVGQKFQLPGCGSASPANNQPAAPVKDNHQQDPPAAQNDPPAYNQDSMKQPGPEKMPPTKAGPVNQDPRPDNQVTAAPTGDRPTTPAPMRIYVVKSGDSLMQIADQYNVDAYAIATVNGIQNMNLLYVGQRLKIP